MNMDADNINPNSPTDVPSEEPNHSKEASSEASNHEDTTGTGSTTSFSGEESKHASWGKKWIRFWATILPVLKAIKKGLKVVWNFVKLSWRWLTPLVVAVVVLLCFMNRGQGLLHNLRNPFKAEPVVIDQTANVVTAVRSLSEYTSVKYVVELPIVKSKAHKEIVLLARGTVRAGFDLSWVDSSCVTINPSTKTLTLRIPPAKVHEVICSPNDYQIFHTSGSWSNTEITMVKRQARAEIEKRALEDGILERAEKIGLARLEEILMAFGFDAVIIEPDLQVLQ